MSTADLVEKAGFPIPGGTPHLGGQNTRAENAKSYRWRKLIGRTRADGANTLNKLSPRHKRIIGLHLEGMSGVRIAEEIGCAYITVIQVLQDPLARQIIDAFHGNVDRELAQLELLSVEALRAALLVGDMPAKMQAVDRVFKARGRYKDREEAPVSAEKVIASLLQIMNDNQQGRTLTRLQPAIIDLKPVEST